MATGKEGEQWGLICSICKEFVPVPEDEKTRVIKREHLEEEHDVWWHEAVRDEETGEVEKI